MSNADIPVVFWTQPLDPMEEDIIQLDGQLLPPTGDMRREDVVRQITAAAESGQRTLVGDGAWVARYKDLIVSELPTSASGGQPGAPIVVGVFAQGRTDRIEVGDLVAGLTAFGSQVGYELDTALARQTMGEVAQSAQSGPFHLRRWYRGAWAGVCATGRGLQAAARWLGAASARIGTALRTLVSR
jgi:hypothetical protein